jgi:hypothetical protein
MGCEDVLGAGVREHRRPRAEQNHPVNVCAPRFDPVVGHHDRPVPGGLEQRLAHGPSGGPVEHRRGFVQQQGTRSERERTGQGQTLLLSATGLPGDMIRVESGVGRPQGLRDPLLDLGPSECGVLRAEGDVASHSGTDQRVKRLLQQQCALAGSSRSGHVPGQVPGGWIEQPGQREQHRGLARSARAHQ